MPAEPVRVWNTRNKSVLFLKQKRADFHLNQKRNVFLPYKPCVAVRVNRGAEGVSGMAIARFYGNGRDIPV
ncbi:hypothetical protein ED312_07790 [Sinomicrobium pectinilyticum]|uniref:Uncharacterized protein n=1 Tax=Sinomicrobium pectinilyticum TaxID=1084421 RepID=A0A3N0ELN3_SINP1|nr:hypothetical protein ED312_07790 [Sinomicrobium pectinilyticum]